MKALGISGGRHLIVVAGPPSAGKTAVVRAVVPVLAPPEAVGYLKVDVVSTREVDALARLGWTCRALVDEAACPDQLLFDRLPRELEALADRSLVVVETAGLCARCAPYLRESLAVAVLEALAGVESALKQGPLLTEADLCVVTHGDRLAPAEREVFASRLAEHFPREIVWFDGLTRLGLPRLLRLVHAALASVPPTTGGPLTPRSAPPRLYCSLCLGRRELPLASGL
jgi:Ni2+-binding GTPase involved in maturation of urease and hydrogenase